VPPSYGGKFGARRDASIFRHCQLLRPFRLISSQLVLDSVFSPITKRVYNLGLDEFFKWYGQEPRPGFTKATVSAWRVALEAHGLSSVSIDVRITAVRKLAIEAVDNGLLATGLASGIARVKGVASKGVCVGNRNGPARS
jgi:hypothetical protein